MTANILHHPTLNCTIRGKQSTSTVQFRNLQYATIPARWQDSVINDILSHDADGVYDATRLGPSCPFNRAAQAWDLTLVGDVAMPMEGRIQEPMDEFSCLQVNVTVPKDHLEKAAGGEQLPVFVWVHGGGLSFGSNNWPQYNLNRFVERSVETGNPVIGVAINYRVGILGFLASTELGIDGNFGYKDQVVAFQWIKKHIAGFGGDPNRITASGESAGGISLSTLLCVDTGREALFEKVVVMSGDATLRKSRVRSWHDMMYQDQLKLLSLDHLDAEKRKMQLRDLDPMELVNKLPIAQHYCACVDGKFLKENISLDLMADGSREEHKPTWCNEFVIGDTRHDVSTRYS
jgi:carboxylesterase type B